VNENVIDVLIYIYETYMDGDQPVPSDHIMMQEELLEAGFRQDEIKKAFDWLDDLAWSQGTLEYTSGTTLPSVRIYTEAESRKLDTEIRGMLLFLEQNGILDPFSREIVIERAMALETEEMSADDVKWIVLLVLVNQPGQEAAFTLMEDLVYNGLPEYLH
jgi:Smg protein